VSHVYVDSTPVGGPLVDGYRRPRPSQP
jgi:hypothetical protein